MWLLHNYLSYVFLNTLRKTSDLQCGKQFNIPIACRQGDPIGPNLIISSAKVLAMPKYSLFLFKKNKDINVTVIDKTQNLISVHVRRQYISSS